MSRTIDYFFGIGSPFAFIGLAPLRELAERHGATGPSPAGPTGRRT
ncbi:hypothetical protein C8J35_1356 [Rhizobium sp. PP-F2F-G38]|nr:hypothetical protein C8J35_1356 [Rhizobium sp. PP-F2F-G38]